MPITHLMSEICNLAYMIVENIVEEEFGRNRNGANKTRPRKSIQRPHRPPDAYRYVSRPPEPPQRP
jgi:hypothetical protein